MSLINQALKKEQNRRSGAPDLRNVPLPPAHRALVAKRKNGDRNTKTVIGICVLGSTLLVALVMVSVTGVKRIINNEIKNPITFTKGENTADKKPAAQTPLAPITPSEPEPLATTVQPQRARTAPNSPADVALQESTSPPAVTQPAPNPNVQQHLEGMQFQAVRLAKANSRILLDGRVYQIGNLIGSGENRLRFTGVKGPFLYSKIHKVPFTKGFLST